MDNVNERKYIKSLIERLENNIDDNIEFQKVLATLKSKYKIDKENFSENQIKMINRIKRKKQIKDLYKKRLEGFYECISWVGNYTVPIRIIMCRVIPMISLILALYTKVVIYNIFAIFTVISAVFIEFVIIDKLNKDPIYFKSISKSYCGIFQMRKDIKVSSDEADLYFFFIPMILNIITSDLQVYLYSYIYRLYIIMYVVILIRDIGLKFESKINENIVGYISMFGMTGLFFLRLATLNSALIVVAKLYSMITMLIR